MLQLRDRIFDLFEIASQLFCVEGVDPHLLIESAIPLLKYEIGIHFQINSFQAQNRLAIVRNNDHPFRRK